MKKIWVYAEDTADGLHKVGLELLTKARELAAEYEDAGEKTEVAAVLLTNSVQDKIETLTMYGAEKIYFAENEAFGIYCHTIFEPVISELVKKEAPDILLIGATATGSELAPSIALTLKTGVAAHCVDMRINEDGILAADVPAFGGKVIGEILIPNHRPQMASTKAGIFVAEKISGEAVSQTILIDTSVLSKANNRLKPIKIETTKSTSKPLEEAEIVIAGGYGLGEPENWELVKELAEKLGGAAGATRPCIDEGWGEGEHIMIGTSGKSVRPKVYVGFGISGATHHLCGMKDSGVIISVNKDENAPIFEVSDYCVKNDAGKILKALLERL